MQNNLKLSSSLLPRMMGTLIHSNQFLKVFCFILLCLSVLLTLGLVFSMNQEPLVITLNNSGNLLEKVGLPKPDDEIKVATKNYILYRYNWEPTNVVKNLKMSESYIFDKSLKAFQGAVSHVAKFSLEKQVAQKAFVELILVNLQSKIIQVKGERVTSIQGLKAAGNLKIELSFDYGPRTKENPWGIYIIKEKEE